MFKCNYKLQLKTTHLIIFSSILLAACGSKSQTKSKDKNTGPVAIDVSIAKSIEFANPIEANGTILASEYVELKPEVQGRITYLNINEGAFVKQGTLLVKLNDEDLVAQLKKLNAQLKLAKLNESRLKVLWEAEGVNQADYDVAVQKVSDLEADIEYNKAMINKTEIKAPFNGVIGLRNVSIGAIVNASTMLATIQQTQSLKVDFVLPETYAESVKTGKKVEIISDAGKSYQAVITGIEPQVNTATRNLKIRAVFNQDIKNLSPGAFVRVIFDEGEAKQRIFVPSNSIIPETRFKKLAVVKHNKIDMVKVETGVRTGDKVEIINGINVGDTFAINGILFLKPGTDIQIRNVK